VLFDIDYIGNTNADGNIQERRNRQEKRNRQERIDGTMGWLQLVGSLKS